MNFHANPIKSARNFAASLRTEQVRQLLLGLPVNASANLLAAFLTATALRGFVAHGALLIWVGAITVLQLSRLIISIVVRKRTPDNKTTISWLRTLRIGAFLTGAIWGMLPIFLFPQNFEPQIILIIIAAGISGAAVAALSVDRISALLLVTSTLLPLLVRLFIEGGDVQVASAAMMTLYFIYLAITAHRVETSFIEMVSLREQVNRQNAELRKTQHLARLGSWSLELASGKLDWSEEVYTIYARDPQHFKPMLTNFYAELVHPEDLNAVKEAEQVAYQIPGNMHRIDHRVILPSGEIAWVHIDGMVMLDDDGQASHIVGTVQDITERKTTEQALIAARNEANRANTAKSEFLSNMSHELRTPLNAILGFSQLMQSDQSLSEENRENLQEIGKAGEHLLELINEVLDLAKVESGHLDLSLQAVLLEEVIDECMSLASTLAEKRNIKLYPPAYENYMVLADRMRLKQALLNLLSNAVKYNRSGGSVTLSLQAVANNRLRILVTDTGSGISAEQLDEIFQPFKRLGAEYSGTEGTGIGLTITRHIVELMGGTIGVESEAGVGSTFWIELALADDDVHNRCGASHASPAPAQQNITAEYTVLYIEDNPANLKLVEKILGKLKHIRMLPAHTPALGIKLAQLECPDLILLDINMPDMDGYQVLEKLKNMTQLKDTPIVAVTAYAMPSDFERGKAAGFTDYVSKPINVDYFLNLIKTLLADKNKTSQ